MTTTKKTFKLPEKDEKFQKEIETLKAKREKLRPQLDESKEELIKLNDIEEVIEDELTKDKKIAQALGDSNSNVKKSEENNILLNEKKAKLEKQIETLGNDLGKINNEIARIQTKDELTHFIDLQQLLWNLQQDIIKNGANHTDLINEIKNILYKKPYLKYMKRMITKDTFEGYIRKVKKVN